MVTEAKGGKPFELPHSDVALQVVERRKAATNSEWLFPADSASGHIEEPRARAGEFSRPFSIHALRHTYALVAVVAKVHAFALKLLMKHTLPGGDITAG